jgi:hypothetical protein
MQPNAPAPANEPMIPPEEFRAAAARVGESPSAAMILSPYTQPTPQRGPGQPGERELAQQAQGLLREVAQAGGNNGRGPVTTQDWDGFLQDRVISALTHLNPGEQAAALATVERIRAAGMRQGAGLAVAAAQAGDAEGAARALTVMNQFIPDGHRAEFRAGSGGITMTRRPEQGGGEPTTVTVPLAEVARYATAAMDPTWSLNHFLNVDKHRETVRSNQTREGLEAARIGESRAARGEARAARNEERAGNDAYVRAQETVLQAEQAIRRLGDDATDAQREAAQSALEEARAARTRALAAAGERGIRTANTIAAQQRLDEDRDAARNRLTDAQRTAWTAAASEFEDDAQNRTGRGSDARVTNEAQLALNLGLQVFERNRSYAPGRVLNALREAQRPGSGYSIDPERGVLTGPGITLRLPPPETRRSTPGGAGGGASSPLRPAPTEGGTPAPNPSLAGARTPPAPPPIATEREAPAPTREERTRLQETRATEQAAAQTRARTAYERDRDERMRRAGVSRLQDLPTADRRALLNGHAGGYSAADRRILVR